MPHNRTRDWRRANARRHLKSNKQSNNTFNWPPKKWKHLHIRATKLHRARQIGKIWPNKEWTSLMKDSAPVKILFVCSKNQWRSPTGEAIFRNVEGISTRSAGTSRNAKHPINIKDIRWADLILVMEQKHLSRIKADFRDETRYKQVHTLNIPDEYQFMNPDLIQLLETKTAAILNELKL